LCTPPGEAPDLSEGGELRMFRDFFRRLHIQSQLLKEEHGQTMAEYALVLAVITLVAATAFVTLGGKIGPAVDKVSAFIK
jgi:Flp pilus assembly pilin Flp